MSKKELKEKITAKINKAEFLDSEIKWGLINFSASLIVVIFCVASIVTASQASTNNSISLGIVYGGYLPSALINIIFCIFVSLSTYKQYKEQAFKMWYFYLPFMMIFLEAIVLPIPMYFVSTSTMNAGVLWSIIVFGFINLGFAIANFITIYKVNLTTMSYVIEESEEEDSTTEK